MADTLDNSEFWLPSEFLTADDMLLGSKNGLNAAFGADFGFPAEFPYDFGSYSSSSALSSPVESVVGSTETESDEDDLLSGMTRQLARFTLQRETKTTTSAPYKHENFWALSDSPQSTLCAAGSWSGLSAVSSNGSPNGPSQFPSPPTTPLGGNSDDWDLIYAAARQVARLKMNGERHPGNKVFLGTPWSLTTVHHPSPPVKYSPIEFHTSQYLSQNLSQTIHFGHARQGQMLERQCSSIWGIPDGDGIFHRQNRFRPQQVSQNVGRELGGVGFDGNGRHAPRPLGLPQSAWPTLQVRHQNQQPPQQGGSAAKAVFLGGAGVRRESAGTGVFIPRRHIHPSESRKKQGSSVYLPARVVMSAQSQAQSRFGADHETLMARRNALLTQQRNLMAEGAVNHEPSLPPEWTY